MKDYFWIIGYERNLTIKGNDITLNIDPIFKNGFQYNRILTFLKFYVNHNTLYYFNITILQKYYYFYDMLYTA